MPNASTIRRQVSGTQVLTIAPLLASAISTTKTAFSLNANALTATGGGYNGGSNGNTGVMAGGVIPLSCGVTGLYQGTGQVFRVSGTGTVVGATAATSTLVVTLYQVSAALVAAGLTATTFTNWNSVFATSALTLTDADASFTFDARLQLDPAGNLGGQATANIDGATVLAWTVVTPITGLVGEADLNFVVAITLGGAEPSTEIVTLNEFRIDLE